MSDGRDFFARAGFTLIELLVAMAIIAILAAIALPNLLESQARAKVGRELADMRTIATALEAYAVDHNCYPPHGEILANGTVQFPATQAGKTTVEYVPGFPLTTPLGYLAALPEDCCLSKKPAPLQRRYGYVQTRQMVEIMAKRTGWTDSVLALPNLYGEWRLYAAGPDADKGEDFKAHIPYDATNGTLSNGDLLRTQRQPLDSSSEDEHK